jgi:ABC-2 type transport system ATP-binding protein
MLLQGTTLVFVSHDLAAVEGISERAVWLHDGLVQQDGPVRDVLTSYRQALERVAELSPSDDGPVRVLKAEVVGPDRAAPRTNDTAEVVLVLRSSQSNAGRLCIGFSEGPASPIVLFRHDLHLPDDDDVVARCRVEHLPLPRGRYFLWLGVFQAKGELLGWQPVAHFDVIGPNLDEGPAGIARLSPVYVAAHWNVGRE